MIPLDNVFMLNADESLTLEKIRQIYEEGYSRIPVY